MSNLLKMYKMDARLILSVSAILDSDVRVVKKSQTKYSSGLYFALGC